MRSSRPAVATIDLNALRHNYAIAKQAHGASVMAVVKADAYGHGAVRCALALEREADGFAVATLEEAIALREAGIQTPILLLEGVFEQTDWVQVDRYRLWAVVHSEWQLDGFAGYVPSAMVKIWLKVNTGMNRLGIAPKDIQKMRMRCQQTPGLSVMSVMSHFARADSVEDAFSHSQMSVELLGEEGLDVGCSLANSAAILAWPAARRQWARAGIMLYGVDPCLPSVCEPKKALRTVMTLSSKIIAEQTLSAGDWVGYGQGCCAPGPMRVGIVALGYADGYPRLAGSGAPVSVDGSPSSILGRVSMDMTTVDLTHLPQASIGSEVQFWGGRVDIREVAAHAQTIPYELFCHVKRVERRFIE